MYLSIVGFVRYTANPPHQPGYEMKFDSDSEGSIGEDANRKPYKRRRLHGACDTCKKKKTKCDSAVMPNKICSNCIHTNVECTRTIPRQKKRDRQQEYINQLEERIRQMEKQLGSSPRSISSPSHRTDTDSTRFSSPTSSKSNADIRLPIPHTLGTSSPASLEEEQSDSDVDTIAGRILHLSLECKDNYFGKSSLISFASQAAVAQTEYSALMGSPFTSTRREALWSLRPWEREYADAPGPTYVFPEPDLLEILLGAYREMVHPQLPVLHWPSFLRDVRKGRHYEDSGFGRVLLAVCAAASRYTGDERVLMIDPEHPELSGSSAGWRFLSQTPLIRPSIIDQATVLDLQYYALAVFTFVGTSSPQTSWNLLGLAMRLAVEKGMHRRKYAASKPKGQAELDKRIFWSLLTLEWLTSACVGRPSCLHDEDIDIEYPIEVDDEYWDSEVDDPSQAFIQPPNKPTFMLRTLYSTKKSKLLTGSIGDQWERRIVSELDSSMNKWKDSLPQHLRWDPNTPNPTHFNEQALLHSGFYYLQIQIHRPFLQSKSELSLPALAICTNAARATSRLANSVMKRQEFPSMNVFTAALAASTVLVINSCSRTVRLSYDSQEDLRTILNLLKLGEKRWQLAGRFVDVVTEFCTLGDIPLPTSSSKKRCRSPEPAGVDADSPEVPLIDEAPAYSWLGLGLNNGEEASWIPADPVTSSIQSSAGNLPPYNPDWDLSTLLLTQLGYGEGNLEPLTTPRGFNGDSNKVGLGDLSAPPALPDISAMSMWMSAPVAFSIEEWNNYLAGLNQRPLTNVGS